MSGSKDPAISVKEASERLRVTEQEIQRLVESGLLRTIDGDSDRIDVVSVIEHLGRQMSAAASSLKGAEAPSPGGVIGAMLIPLVLVLLTLAVFVEIFSLRDNNALIPHYLFPIVIPAALLWLRWLAQRQPDFSTANGMGVSLYGDKTTDEGRIGTAWVVCLMVPLVPVDSYIIVERGTEDVRVAQRTKNYILRKRAGLYWPQVVPVLAGVWAGLGLAFWLATTL